MQSEGLCLRGSQLFRLRLARFDLYFHILALLPNTLHDILMDPSHMLENPLRSLTQMSRICLFMSSQQTRRIINLAFT